MWSCARPRSPKIKGRKRHIVVGTLGQLDAAVLRINLTPYYQPDAVLAAAAYGLLTQLRKDES